LRLTHHRQHYYIDRILRRLCVPDSDSDVPCRAGHSTRCIQSAGWHERQHSAQMHLGQYAQMASALARDRLDQASQSNFCRGERGKLVTHLIA
jgi:hypothetical protein